MAGTGETRRRPMAGGELLAGEGRPGATGHGFPIHEHLEKEEDEGNSIPPFARPGRGSRTTVRGGAIADPPEHTVMALRRIKSRGEKCGRERRR